MGTSDLTSLALVMLQSVGVKLTSECLLMPEGQVGGICMYFYKCGPVSPLPIITNQMMSRRTSQLSSSHYEQPHKEHFKDHPAETNSGVEPEEHTNRIGGGLQDEDRAENSYSQTINPAKLYLFQKQGLGEAEKESKGVAEQSKHQFELPKAGEKAKAGEERENE